MNIPRVDIRLGLPEHCCRQAARIYYQAFRQKLEPIMGSQEHGVAVLEKDFDPELAIVALRQGQLAGLAGLQYGGRRFINFRVHALYRAVTRRQRRGQLLMNGIAVDAALRGQEVGTRLLQAVFDLAQDNGFDSIRLDVVDTNPGARRLYERMGYENN